MRLHFGNPKSLQGRVRPILSNENIFGIDLYRAGLGNKIEVMLCQMLEEKGAVRRTLSRYLA